MSRSLKKGPYINYKLQRKVDAMNKSGKNSVIKDVGKEVKIVEEKEHTRKCGKELLFKWEQLKESVSEFEGVDIVSKRNYITLMLGNKTVSYFNFRKDSILIELSRGTVKSDGTRSRNYFDVDDPKKISYSQLLDVFFCVKRHEKKEFYFNKLIQVKLVK